MRMTRAALRAQESEEALRAEVDTQLKQQKPNEDFDDLLIHEDSDRETSGLFENEDRGLIGDRIVFKDITAQNHPSAEAVLEMEAKRTTRSKKSPNDRNRTGKQEIESSPASEESPIDKAEDVGEEVATVVNLPIVEDHTSQTTMIEAPLPETQQESDSSLQSTNHKSVDVIQTMNLVEQGQTSDETTEVIMKTPRFDPAVHLPAENVSLADDSALEDSFVGTIKARSPCKHANPQHGVLDIPPTDSATVTPAKLLSSPRVEDSVAALDALEDAIEKFAEELPSLDSMEIISPTKTRVVSIKTPAKTPGKTPAKTPLRTAAKSALKSSTKATTPARAITTSNSAKPLAERLADAKRTSVKERVKAIEARPNPVKHRRATSVVVTKSSTQVLKPVPKLGHAASKSVSSISAKPMVSFSNSPLKENPVLGKKRITSGPLSTSKPGFVPAKSVKPPTKASFILPGEAIAAKLKAQRDERLIREEAAMEKKREFKARPNPVKTAGPSVLPRENKASQARMSIGAKQGGENKENVAPVKDVPAKTSVASTKTRTDQTQAKSGVRNSTMTASNTNIGGKPSVPNARVFSNGSATSATSTSSTVKTATKGREVYGRHRQTLVEQQREKKDKEEAAKKARAEAAEKGRQASREWAEKQKRKLLAEEAKSKAEGGAVTA